MENADSATKKSKPWIFLLIGLLALIAAAGVWFYQSTRHAAESAAVVNADQQAENAASAEKQAQPQKKAVAQKKESGSVLDKFKSIDIEVRGAKNPCTQTERMMKQCTD